MGCYDTILVACPKCGEIHGAQTKSSDCSMRTWKLEDAPVDALIDVNRHAPFICKCGTGFVVKKVRDVKIIATSVEVPADDPDLMDKKNFNTNPVERCSKCGRLLESHVCEYCNMIED